MFFSSSKKSEDSSSSAASSSSSTSSVPSSSTTTSADSSQSWTEGGGAGLGVVPSLSPECTPLKHHYDSCFDKWFTDYLSIGDAQILKQQRQSAADSQSEKGADASKKGSSWFGGAGSDSGSAWSSLTGQGDSSTDPDLERKKKEIMERYDRDCGKLFRDYQSCVKVIAFPEIPTYAEHCFTSKGLFLAWDCLESTFTHI